MENDTCIIITGLILDAYIDSLLFTYRDIKNKMIVTWKDQDNKLLQKLENNGFMIVLNDYPKKKCSVNYQTKNIYTGLLKAKDMYFKYIIRMRTDVYSDDFLKFMGVIRHLYIEKFSCICGQGFKRGFFNGVDHISWNVNYFQDFCIAGPVDKIIPMFIKEQSLEDHRFPEIFWLHTYFNKEDMTADEIKHAFNFFITLMETNKIIFYWIKDNTRVDLLKDLKNKYIITF